MELTHAFTVPADVEKTWAAFNDIEGVAACFPGATVTSAEGDSFEGTCKVKLGPIALTYKGSGSFVDKDESGHRLRIEAKGKDRRGNGTAGANVSAVLTPEGSSTQVTVVTDLTITGKPAQFGRGVIQDVSDKLLGQFVQCLERKLGGDEPAGPAAPTQEQAAVDEPTSDEQATPRPPTQAPPGPVSTPASSGDDALDLGATVLPVLAKTYWRQAAAAVLAVLVVLRIRRRRRR